MADPPQLKQMRQRVAQSADLHRSTIGPQDSVRPDGKLRIHTQGFDSDEKARISNEESARINLADFRDEGRA
jgi:hypothetical protein